MKTTIRINLSGQIFTLDEDAYQMLKEYLDAIGRRFRDMEEGKEITDDIESRIAELFQFRITEKKKVITIEDVREVIEIMGHPEDFDEGMETEAEVSSRRRSGRKSRRFYRDPDHTVFGGVASGLAAYFGIETWIMRLLWVVFFLATGGGVIFILYVVLWIAVPKANTAAEKLEMRGEKVTVENIEKTVREEYETVKASMKENYRKVKDSSEFKKTKNVFNEILNVIGQILLVLFKVVAAIIGIALIIGGLSVLAGLSIGFFFRNALFPIHILGSSFHTWHEIFGTIGDPTNMLYLSIALFFLIVIPVITLIYAGIKILFRFKARDKRIGLAAFVLWILSLIFLISMVAFEGLHFNEFGASTTTHEIKVFPSDTIFVTIRDEPGIEGFEDSWYFSYDERWRILAENERNY